MAKLSPWDGIKVPSADYNVKRIPGSPVVPCFWGRDNTGACLYIIELEGDHEAEFRNKIVRVNGITTDLRTHKGQQRLVLKLEKQADRDLFEGLCLTLTRSIENASNSVDSLAIALTHLKRWKTFMSGRAKHLSDEEVRGLYAELVFLLELLRKFPAARALESWKGPDRSQHDFIFGNTSIEVKSLSGAEKNSVRISSEDQLESLNDYLYLRIYRLSVIPESPAARSLNNIILEVQLMLDDPKSVEEFDRKLMAHSYAPLPEYDAPCFVVSDVRTYFVESNFPRLVRSKLPNGISRTSYDLRLDIIDPFTCNSTAIFGEYDGTDS